MASDLDSLEDLFLQPANSSVRAVGKFRPKAKLRSKIDHLNQLSSIPSDSGCAKQTSTGFTSSDLSSSGPCSTTHTDYSTGIEMQELTIYRSADHPVSLGNRDLPHVEESISVSPSAVPESVSASDDPLCDVAMLTGVGHLEPDDGRSTKEATEFFTGFESLDDLLIHASSSTGVELVSPLVGSQVAPLNHADLPQISSMEFSTVAPGSSAPENSSVKLSETTFFYENKDLEVDHGSKEATGYSGLESLDDIFLETIPSSVKGKGNFRPKPKTITVAEQLIHPSSHTDAGESNSLPLEAEFHPTEKGCTKEGSTPLQDASADFSRIIPCVNADLEFPHMKNRKRKTSNASEEIGEEAQLQELQQVAPSSEELDGGKSSRKLRKRIINESPVNETDAETDETSNTSILAEDYNDDDEYRGEKEMPEKNTAPSKPRGPTATNGNQVNFCGGESELPDSANKKPPKKKFSHSTRRNRRLVNKELLDTPEDEIDPTKLILKDLILLAEIKERKMIKEAAALKKSFPNPSNNDPSHQNITEEDDPLDSHRIEPSSFKLNYHSFMVKTPKERWSPSDTKLFYEFVKCPGYSAIWFRFCYDTTTLSW
ncbi:uncharacterized protein [Aristolochia californica]|uniref:uncharacterized protein isoform X2 n=1 Tax=Aristolochia californica TaxID=171875 RepID=UPI0035D9C2C6